MVKVKIFALDLEMEISLVPPSFPLTSVRYRNRPILSCSAFPRGEIELDCPVEDPLTSTANNTMDEKMYRTSVTIAAATKTVAEAMDLKLDMDNPADREKLRRAVLDLVAGRKMPR